MQAEGSPLTSSVVTDVAGNVRNLQLLPNEFTRLHGSSLLNTLMSPNLCIAIKRGGEEGEEKKNLWTSGLLPSRLSTLAWKQLGNCFEMLYVVQALVQYHVTLHMFARGKQRMLSALFSGCHK